MQIPLVAQTGPAGVGSSSSNKVWLDASSLTALANGSMVSTWTDRSGNSWNAYQNSSSRRPTYVTNQLNGYPVIRFDRTNGGQWLDITSIGIGAAMSNSSTLFAVTKANSGGVNDDRGQWQSVFGAVEAYSGILFQGFPTTTHFYIDGWVGNPPANDLVVRSSITQGQWYIATRLPKESATTTTLSGFVNGINAGSRSSNLQLKNHNNLARIGAPQASGTHQYLLNGDIAEIIFFNVNLSEAQRIIVENYLASKYALTISNDHYSGDAIGFTRDVQGIGTTDGSSVKHSVASNGKGILLSEINNTLNNPNEFLFAGHASPSNGIATTDLPPGEQSRWQRIWYIEKTGDIDAKLAFDFSQAGLSPDANLSNSLLNYKLLYRSTTSEIFSVVKTNNQALIPTLENNDQLAFSLSNMQLQTGYYTIAYSPVLIWTGSVSNGWNVAGNWNLNRIPTVSDHVYVDACTICPRLSNSVNIAALNLNPGSALDLQSNTLSVEGTTFLRETRIQSQDGIVKTIDFGEIKNSFFAGALALEKISGSDNSLYGGNTFSSDLKLLNSSESQLEVATQSNNIIKSQ